MTTEQLARRFHEAYERLAPEFGHETLLHTRTFDPNSANGRLMIAVCAELFPEAPSSNLVLEGAITKLTDGRRAMLLYSEAVALRDEMDRLRRIAAAADKLLLGINEFGDLKYVTERIQALDDALDGTSVETDCSRLVAEMLPYVQHFECADAAELEARAIMVQRAERYLASLPLKTTPDPATLGAQIICEQCGAETIMRFTDETKTRVSLEGIEGWTSPPVRCPKCSSPKTDACSLCGDTRPRVDGVCQGCDHGLPGKTKAALDEMVNVSEQVGGYDLPEKAGDRHGGT